MLSKKKKQKGSKTSECSIKGPLTSGSITVSSGKTQKTSGAGSWSATSLGDPNTSSFVIPSLTTDARVEDLIMNLLTIKRTLGHLWGEMGNLDQFLLRVIKSLEKPAGAKSLGSKKKRK